jgi:hypothetical protein
MKIDYSKYNYSRDECEHMNKETQLLQEKNSNHVPVLIMIKSSVLKMEKQKFLVSNDIIFSDFITNTLKKKLIGLNENDTLTLCTVKLDPEGQKSESKEIAVNSSLMKDIYEEYKDIHTNLLIFKVSRNTTYKYLKGSLKYWAGY